MKIELSKAFAFFNYYSNSGNNSSKNYYYYLIYPFNYNKYFFSNP